MNGLRRDQRRAMHAYARVRDARDKLKDDWTHYKVAVDMLGPAVLQNGLVAAFAFLERELGKAANKRADEDPSRGRAGARKRLLDDLAKAGIPGLDVSGAELPARVRDMNADEYMLATREVLLVAHWFKRAAQALDAS